MQALDREQHPGVEYGVEDLAALAADEDCPEAKGGSNDTIDKGDDQPVIDDQSENGESEEPPNITAEKRRVETQISTGDTEPTRRRVTFQGLPQNEEQPATEPRRSGRERQLPIRYRQN